MYGGGLSGIIFGPVITIWAAIRLAVHFRDTAALLAKHPRAIRPDEFAPYAHLRLRIVLTTLFYLAVIAFAASEFIHDWSRVSS